MGKIISAFAGVGKSYVGQKYKNVQIGELSNYGYHPNTHNLTILNACKKQS